MRSLLRHKDSLLPGMVTARAAKELVPELDEHVAALSILFHQYLKHAWVSRRDAPRYSELASAHRIDVFAGLDAVGQATLTLGGVPLGSPLEHVNRSYLEHEDEGIYDLKDMVMRTMFHESRLALHLNITREAAQELGAVTLPELLEELQNAAKIRRGRLESFAKGVKRGG